MNWPTVFKAENGMDNILLTQNNEITVGIRIMFLFVQTIFFSWKKHAYFGFEDARNLILAVIKYSFNQFVTQTTKANLSVRLDH